MERRTDDTDDFELLVGPDFKVSTGKVRYEHTMGRLYPENQGTYDHALNALVKQLAQA
jgi:hypothetical protein